MGGKEFILYTDADRDRLTFQRMKKDMNGKAGIVIFRSADVLGASKDTIMKELTDFMGSKWKVLFLAYPTMNSTDDLQTNHKKLQLVLEVVSERHMEVIPFPERHKVHAGRKELSFPEKWDEFYERWENGEITAQEFMAEAHLKRGTFYHMVKEYRASHALVEKIVVGQEISR